MEANLVKGLLESNDIKVFIIDENVSRINPAYNLAIGGIKLVVPASNIEIAKEILREYLAKAGQNPEAGKLSPFDFSSKPNKVGVLAAIVGYFFAWPFAAAILGWFGVKRRDRDD